MRDCQLCGPTDDEVVERHKDSLAHRVNYYLCDRSDNRKNKINCHGIFIDQHINQQMLTGIQISVDDVLGMCHTKLSVEKFAQLGNKLEYEFTVRNDRSEEMWIFVVTLHPFDKYYLTDFRNVVSRRLEFVLEPNKSCNFLLTFKQSANLTTMGTYTLPIAITAQPARNPIAYKTVYRDVEIQVGELAASEMDSEQSPFRKEHWPNVEVIEPTNQPKHLENFKIPEEYKRVYLYGFNGCEGESGLLQHYRMETADMWERGVTPENYSRFFHRLLWLEECTQLLGIRQYNMSEVTVTVVRNNVILPVPGLAEKRPSVLKGDLVLLRLTNEQRAYKGVVELVEDESLVIEYLDPELLMVLRSVPDITLDVNFQLSRLQLERMHTGVEMCIQNLMLNCSLFPERPFNRVARRSIAIKHLFNPNVAINPQQLIAVESILSCTSQRAPYIIFGPPGTGKTVTLVEAILQINKHHPDKRILVCAPSNAACDMLAMKLDEQMRDRQQKDLFRIHTGNRHINDIPKAVKYFSNLDGGEFYQVKPSDLKDYKIVISTLHLIGKYTGDYSPDMLFIDEAAQTTEPECDIPIGLLAPGMPIVLAGDPRQLGPVCGVLSGKKGLAKSLLDRLMESNQLYRPVRQRPLEYDNDFITMLVRNYRSHEDIVAVPNDLFYEGSLQFSPHRDEISTMSIAGLEVEGERGAGAAIEFVGLLSKEQRQGNSPSYYNPIEIETVCKLIERMLSLTTTRVAQRHIGVIAPYIRQVVKIRNKLEQRLGPNEIQVGTTEAFQGGERRVMIISTVRAQSDLLLYDRKYDLGFVRHERRFNVAITRAQSKLIIVGNPHVLAYDQKCWVAIMDHCKSLNSYYGEDVRRDDGVREKILPHFQPRAEE